MSPDTEKVKIRLLLKNETVCPSWSTEMYVVQLEGSEGMSQLFDFEIRLFYTGKIENVSLGAITNEKATLSFTETETSIKGHRRVEGIISQIRYEGAMADNSARQVHGHGSRRPPSSPDLAAVDAE